MKCPRASGEITFVQKSILYNLWNIFWIIFFADKEFNFYIYSILNVLQHHLHFYTINLVSVQNINVKIVLQMNFIRSRRVNRFLMVLIKKTLISPEYTQIVVNKPFFTITLSHSQTHFDVSAVNDCFQTLWQKEKLLLMSYYTFCHKFSTLFNDYIFIYKEFLYLCQVVFKIFF